MVDCFQGKRLCVSELRPRSTLRENLIRVRRNGKSFIVCAISSYRTQTSELKFWSNPVTIGICGELDVPMVYLPLV